MSTPAAYRRTSESLHPTAVPRLGSWRQRVLLLLSCWIAVCPTAVLAASVSPQPSSNSASPSAAGPSAAGPSAAVPVRDARLLSERCQGSTCCCSAQVCRCCALEVKRAAPARIPAVGSDSVLGSDQNAVNVTAIAEILVKRDFETSFPRASLCDCGCQRPLTPPAAPGSTNFSVLTLLACRQPLQAFLSTYHAPSDWNPSTSSTTLGSKLLALGGPTRRQAALHRWLI